MTEADRKFVQGHMVHLNPLHQKVLRMRFIEGASREEIREELGKSQSQSNNTIHNALRALRMKIVTKHPSYAEADFEPTPRQLSIMMQRGTSEKALEAEGVTLGPDTISNRNKLAAHITNLHSKREESALISKDQRERLHQLEKIRYQGSLIRLDHVIGTKFLSRRDAESLTEKTNADGSLHSDARLVAEIAISRALIALYRAKPGSKPNANAVALMLSFDPDLGGVSSKGFLDSLMVMKERAEKSSTSDLPWEGEVASLIAASETRVKEKSLTEALLVYTRTLLGEQLAVSEIAQKLSQEAINPIALKGALGMLESLGLIREQIPRRDANGNVETCWASGSMNPLQRVSNIPEIAILKELVKSSAEVVDPFEQYERDELKDAVARLTHLGLVTLHADTEKSPFSILNGLSLSENGKRLAERYFAVANGEPLNRTDDRKLEKLLIEGSIPPHGHRNQPRLSA